MMVSIVIPAHNEEAVIGRSLERLLSDESLQDLNIVVACNGCKDQTANVARKYGPRVTVLETDVPSKTHAMNLGDKAAKGFPRIYMDADVVLNPSDIRELANALNSGTLLAAAPQMELDLSRSSWLVKAFYDVWRRLPYVQSDMIGVGVYAVSATGRDRFGEFPSIIADDGFVRILFKPEERATIRTATSIVSPPATLASLIKISTRSRLGLYQIKTLYPELLQNDNKQYGGAARTVLLRPQLWPKVPAYLFVNLVARWRAWRQYQTLEKYKWERDESSRQVCRV